MDQHGQNAATNSLATIYGEQRDNAKELREAQQRALDVINARFWNSGLAGCADAARRIGPRMGSVLREATALNDEVTRPVDQMRDAVRAAPCFDTRLSYATRPHEPAPPRAPELRQGGRSGICSRGRLTLTNDRARQDVERGRSINTHATRPRLGQADGCGHGSTRAAIHRRDSRAADAGHSCGTEDDLRQAGHQRDACSVRSTRRASRRSAD